MASVRGDAVVRFAAMQFLILGPLEVSDDGRKLALGGPKQRAVLAHLILRANHVVPADLLIDGLWGEEPPESARNTLQTYVYRLRKVLGDGIGSRAATAGTCSPPPTGEIDAARFEALVKQGKAEVASDPGDGRRDPVRRALAVARGRARRRDRGAIAPGRGGAARGAAAVGHRAPGLGRDRDGRSLHRRPRARVADRALPAPGADVGQPDARAVPLRPPGRGAVDVRASPPGAGRRARRRSLARAAATARADPAAGARARGVPARRRDHGPRSARAVSTCNRAPRSPATASNGPWGGAA